MLPKPKPDLVQGLIPTIFWLCWPDSGAEHSQKKDRLLRCRWHIPQGASPNHGPRGGFGLPGGDWANFLGFSPHFLEFRFAVLRPKPMNRRLGASMRVVTFCVLRRIG